MDTKNKDRLEKIFKSGKLFEKKNCKVGGTGFIGYALYENV